MHEAFVAASREFFDTVAVVAYPPDAVLDYAQLEQRVRASLPLQPFVLVGESFSGPIALAIAADPPPMLRGLVLPTSFARAPLPFSGVLAAAARIAPVRATPLWFLSWLLLGSWSSPALRAALAAAMARVAPDVLRARAATALRADVRGLDAISVPVLYLRATHDRLLARSASVEIASRVPNVEVIDIAGPHLLLQASPRECAQAVGRFAAAIP